jgi:hypothetical protein
MITADTGAAAMRKAADEHSRVQQCGTGCPMLGEVLRLLRKSLLHDW